jgi:dethiobiotin synthetase
VTARLFVTGTGTGVGKTWVARAIVAAWGRRGLRVAALKPVETGVPFANGIPAPADALALARAAGAPPDVRDLCRVALPDPVSPHLAAARAGTRIDIDELAAFVRERSVGFDAVIVEGAGGLLAPLSGEALQADFAARLGWPLLVVAPNVLGGINHALLTIEAAVRRGVPLAGVVLNRTAAADFGNAAAIARHGRVPVLGELPDAPDDDDGLAALAEAHLDLDALLERARGKSPLPPFCQGG